MSKNYVFVSGINKTFSISDKCKKYTLRDNGFEQTAAGNFQLNRVLDAGNQSIKYRLKVTVSKDLEQLKISTTNLSGLSKVDIYKLKNNDMLTEKFEFLLEGLVDRDVLIVVE